MSLRSTIHVLRMFAPMVGRLPAGHLWYLWRRMHNEKPHRFAGRTRINTFFPPHPSAAFDRFCEAIVARRRVPFSTYLAVTHACPYRCEHCSSAGRIGGPELSREELLDLVAQIKALGTGTLGFTGGEPMLRDELPELVAAGVDCVTVGMESADRAAHDAARGVAGSFAEAERAVAVCRGAGIYTAISTVATRRRLDDGQLERLFELGSRWGVGEFRVLAPVATGRQVGCTAFMLDADERRRLAEFHVRHNRRRGGPAVACFAYLESPELFGCGAGFHHLYIDATGNVCPCDLTPAGFGTVRDEPLAAIWGRMASHFPLPRRACLMHTLAGRLAGEPLPLSPDRSEALLPPRDPAETLPEGYRRLRIPAAVDPPSPRRRQ